MQIHLQVHSISFMCSTLCLWICLYVHGRGPPRQPCLQQHWRKRSPASCLTLGSCLCSNSGNGGPISWCRPLSANWSLFQHLVQPVRAGTALIWSIPGRMGRSWLLSTALVWHCQIVVWLSFPILLLSAHLIQCREKSFYKQNNENYWNNINYYYSIIVNKTKSKENPGDQHPN